MQGLGNAILKAQLRTCESVHVIRGLRRPASAPPASHLARLFLGAGRQPAGPLFRSVRDATLLLPRQLRTRRSSALVIFPQLCPCLDPSRPLHGVSCITVPNRQSRGKIKEQPLQPRPHHLGLLAWRRECSVLTSPCGCPGGMHFPAFLALGSHGLSYSEGCRGSTPEL